MQNDDYPVNPSTNETFDSILARRLARRTVLAGSASAAATAFFAGSASAATAAVGAMTAPSDQPLVGFTPVPPDGGPMPTISEDYNMEVLVPWGTPLLRGAPEFSYPPTGAEAQEMQVGSGHDGMWFFPLSVTRGLLCMNHEFAITPHIVGKPVPETLEEVRTVQAAHGISVIDLKRRRGKWQVEPSHRNRRITVNTPVRFAGPVANSGLLDNDADNEYQGTLNNCANGYTPWGTYLTCEENFNAYFAANDAIELTPEQERYGIGPVGFGFGWEKFDPRWDLSNPDYANESLRFGWVVEIDPYKPNSKPVKRTAMGRFKHEGCALTIGKGLRAVAYMGDDQRFDYLYKFVSAGSYRSMMARGLSPLDRGSLYAARFNEDGTGEWLELTIDNPAIAERYTTQAEVLTFARVAADLAGATPMDRPEWTTVAPNGDAFCSLSNNTDRTEPNAANPQAPNPDGHIIRWRDADDHVGTTFEWDVFVFGSDTRDTDYEFTDPDGLWADPDGRLFIQTDGGQPNGNNNQMLIADIETGEIRRLLTGVTGCEMTGIALTPNRRTMFVNVQHPGNYDPSVTTFGDDEGRVPRDATLVITRKDGGIIGS